MRALSVLRILAVLSVELGLALANGSSHCCQALSDAGLGDALVYSGVEAYENDLQKYFSKAAVLTPQCFLQPRDTTEVSLAVKTLVAANKTEPCQFAIRGGGHTHFAGAAGIEKGVTIDLGMIKDVVYFQDNSSVSVGGGAVWSDVYEALDKIGVMVAGGRASSVGVGGLSLGGGNSYYAARYGWVCDNVLRYEIVLANGTVVVATKDDYPDLWLALKGGSSNFGVVTRYDFAAFDGGKIFGGVVMYPGDTADKQLQAILNFGDNIEKDPYGSAIVISIMMSDTKTPMFMNAYDYTKSVDQLPSSVFGEFLSIPGNISDSTGLRNMTSLAHEFEVPKDHRVHFSTLTFKSDIRVMRKAHEAYENVTKTLVAQAKGDWAIYTLYQPIPTLFSRHSKEKGGNVLGLDRFKENLIMYEPYLKWQGADQDELFNSQARYLRDTISSYAKSIKADNDWLYLNYADKEQAPLEGYGLDNVHKIRAAAQKYDPDGVFQYMMPGGFKISQVKDSAVPGAESHPKVGVIAGGVVGGVVGVALILGALLFFLLKTRAQQRQPNPPKVVDPVIIHPKSERDD
ncbi:FAD-dependent monooxygenase CTB5 [Pseudocercospora fuligena]|uniref:FAD-dependent monooxygenase CTB5 n=1 Tax=Pseudocercospora fuligena TaxID=685502 RepID=A0A8H6RMA2_9PEZI|nr:FAD-dependent monooxygenase CTB5 [Pseudocercospora fuligena]